MEKTNQESEQRIAQMIRGSFRMFPNEEELLPDICIRAYRQMVREETKNGALRISAALCLAFLYAGYRAQIYMGHVELDGHPICHA